MNRADVTRSMRDLLGFFDPRQPHRPMPHRVVAVLAVLLSLSMVWFALAWKMHTIGEYTRRVGYLDTFATSVIGGLAAWLLVLLIVRRRLVLPLVLFLSYLGWIYVRAYFDGDHTRFLLTGIALIIVTFFLFDSAEKKPLQPMMTFSAVYLGIGVVFAFFFLEFAFRTDQWAESDLLGRMPYGLFMGIAPHPNHMGPAMALGIMMFAAAAGSALVSKIVVVFLVAALIYTGSDGSYVSLAAALVMMIVAKDYFLRSERAYPWRSIGLGVMFIAFSAWVISILIERGVNWFTTGRDALWRSLWQPSIEAGWLGLGRFPAFVSRYPDLFDDFAKSNPNPHNVWMMTLLTSGYIGFILLLAFWIAVVVALWKMPPGSPKVLAIGLAVFLSVNGLVESHIVGGFRVYYVLYAVLIALLAHQSGQVVGKENSRQIRFGVRA